MNEHYVEKINEVSKEEQLYKKLISTLKKDGTTYKIDDSKTIGQPRVIIGDYVIGSGTVYHNEYTIYKNKKELESYNSITKVLDYVSNINEAKVSKENIIDNLKDLDRKQLSHSVIFSQIFDYAELDTKKIRY